MSRRSGRHDGQGDGALAIQEEVRVPQAMLIRAQFPDPAAAPDQGSTEDQATTAARPRLRAVVRHLALSLLWANVIPGVLFYACMAASNVWTALVVALAWCYGAMAWRASTRRRGSGLLWLTAAGLTVKTALTMITGSTFFYFVQPAFTDAAIGLLFLVSLRTARPVVARLAADFYPMTEDVARRPRIQQLFWRLTLIWAFICLLRAVATVWLLDSMSLMRFVEVKTVLTPTIAALGAAATVAIACRVARREGLLHAAA